VELDLRDHQDPLIAHIDTACTFCLMMDEATARHYGVEIATRVRGNPRLGRSVRLADGSSGTITMGLLWIVWDGAPKLVAVAIAPGSAAPDDGSQRDSEPKALLGLELLDGNTLTINFCRLTVAIESCLTA
jgi:hypothetical protein